MSSIIKKYFLPAFRLGFSLSRANFKLRNEGSYLGILWYLLDPLLMFGVLFIVFSKNIGSSIEHYPLYLLIGLIIFNFFSSVTSEAPTLITNNGTFIKSIKIPSEALVISMLLKSIYSHLFEIIVLAIFLIFFNIPLINIIFYLPVLLMIILFTAGLAFILSALGVYATDLNNVWRFISQLIFFASPIFYHLEPGQLLFKLNPLAYFITMSREILLYGRWPNHLLIIISLSYAFIFFGLGLIIFNKTKNKFAENV